MNSTEWEITLHLTDFDESWMRYALVSEKLMVKIGHLSMTGSFDPPQSYWYTSKSTINVIEEYFHGDWRMGQEIQKVVITQRLYQISSNSTQA